MDKLQDFYNDKAMQEAFAAFAIEVLNEEALKRVYNGSSTDDIKGTKELFEKVFQALRDRYTPKEEPRVARPRV